MALKNYKPTSPGLRQLVIVDRSELYKGKPEKTLTVGLTKTGGRDNYGHVTSRRIGGGHKRKLRVIDFKRNKFDLEATVERIEYDPNRSAFIALISYEDGEKAYILGLLHDIGRKFGVRHLGHVSDGDSYMLSLGYDEAARICLTHSFNNGRLEEYIGRKSNGDPNSNWATRPATMIRKVAIVQALRDVFPETNARLYSAEEMGVREEDLPTAEVDAKVVNESAPVVKDESKAPVPEKTAGGAAAALFGGAT